VYDGLSRCMGSDVMRNMFKGVEGVDIGNEKFPKTKGKIRKRKRRRSQTNRQQHQKATEVRAQMARSKELERLRRSCKMHKGLKSDKRAFSASGRWQNEFGETTPNVV